MPSAAVVGAGLSGLTAAHRLQQAGWEVQVLESRDRPGGRVDTVRRDGYTVDTGATAVGAGYDDYLELARELQVRLHPSAHALAIRRQGRVHELDMRRLAWSGLRTGLLSPRAKLRALVLGADVVRARRRGYLANTDLARAGAIDDESAQAYARRRLGRELDEYLVAPLTRTMVIANSDQIAKVQLLSAIANAFGDTWLAPDGGAVSMVEALASRLTVHLNRAVDVVRDDGDAGVIVGWTDAGPGFGGGSGSAGPRSEQAFDAAVVAAPLPVAHAICPGQAAQLRPLAERLRYTQTITVSLGTTARPASNALMVLLPPSEDEEIALFFLDHRKAPGRAPGGHGVFTFYWEMSAAARRLASGATDADLVAKAHDTLLATFPDLARATVDFTNVTRWPLALPHVNAGAFAEIGRCVEALDPAARIQFAGDYLSETGMNTAVATGARAARRLLTPRVAR